MKRKKSIFFLLGWNDYRIFQGISRFANRANWQMDTRHFFLNIFPTDRKFDGIIAMYHTEQAIRTYIRKVVKDVPTVILGTQTPVSGTPMVMPDNQLAGSMAARHLYDLFHKNYGWFTTEPDPSGKERKASFEKQLSELGFKCCNISSIEHGFDRNKVMTKLKLCPKPIGILARDDHDASVLIEICHDASIRVPEEVSVIGVGDLESLCSFSQISISSISLNMEELGFRSAEILDKLMRGDKVPSVTVVPAGPLIQRLSTDSLAITEPHLKKALKIIDSQFKTQITMDEIAVGAGVSRRQLYNLFRNEMRCSPHDYITDARLRYAQNLIKTQSLNLTEIAHESGFNTRRTLNRVFIQKFGLPPSKWAKQTRT